MIICPGCGALASRVFVTADNQRPGQLITVAGCDGCPLIWIVGTVPGQDAPPVRQNGRECPSGAGVV